MHRILLVGPLSETGGVSRCVEDLLSARTGYQTELFNTARPPKATTIRGPCGYSTLFAAGVRCAIRSILITFHNIVRFPFKLLSSKASIAHITSTSYWSFWESSFYVIWSRVLGRKVFLHYLCDFQEFYDHITALERAAVRRIFNTVDRVIVLSDGISAATGSFMNKRNIRVIPSWVDLHTSRTNGRRRRSSAGKTRILFMGGNYGARKGVYDLMAAIPSVLAKHDRVEFLLCGGGDVEAAYNRAGQDLRNNVRFCGLVDNATKEDLLSQAHIYILPSYSEGMPYGIIEATAAGCPVIATRGVGAIAEVVVDGVTGMLVEKRNPQQLADAIVKLVENPRLRSKMGRAGSKRFERYYAMEKNVEKIVELYNETLQRKN